MVTVANIIVKGIGITVMPLGLCACCRLEVGSRAGALKSQGGHWRSQAQGWTGHRCRCTAPTEAPLSCAAWDHIRIISVPEPANSPGVGSHEMDIPERKSM